MILLVSLGGGRDAYAVTSSGRVIHDYLEHVTIADLMEQSDAGNDYVI